MKLFLDGVELSQSVAIVEMRQVPDDDDDYIDVSGPYDPLAGGTIHLQWTSDHRGQFTRTLVSCPGGKARKPK